MTRNGQGAGDGGKSLIQLDKCNWGDTWLVLGQKGQGALRQSLNFNLVMVLGK